MYQLNERFSENLSVISGRELHHHHNINGIKLKVFAADQAVASTQNVLTPTPKSAPYYYVKMRSCAGLAYRESAQRGEGFYVLATAWSAAKTLSLIPLISRESSLGVCPSLELTENIAVFEVF